MSKPSPWRKIRWWQSVSSIQHPSHSQSLPNQSVSNQGRVRRDSLRPAWSLRNPKHLTNHLRDKFTKRLERIVGIRSIVTTSCISGSIRRPRGKDWNTIPNKPKNRNHFLQRGKDWSLIMRGNSGRERNHLMASSSSVSWIVQCKWQNKQKRERNRMVRRNRLPLSIGYWINQWGIDLSWGRSSNRLPNRRENSCWTR